VVKEELATHQPEGKVMQTPPYEEESTQSIVLHSFGWEKCQKSYGMRYALLTVVEISETPLCPENEYSTD
jgi:hypothetical protein